jgi:glycosyltransferase involved in cell wall biosynthesis
MKPVFYIPNAVPEGLISIKDKDKVNYVFMSRLHHKKGLIPFVQAWNKVFKGNSNTRLIIAGPDEGELEKLEPYQTENMEYIGPVYGVGKIELLKKAHYFLLPSFSEGLPTSVLEAMSYGAIPLISRGCNFEEVFENQLGYQAEPNTSQLENLLSHLSKEKYDQQKSNKNVEWINQHFSENPVAENLRQEYSKVLNDVHQG